MPANYLKITARRLLRQKAFSLINILGLSTGLAACLLIYLYVHSELTYDAYNPQAGRIARVTSELSRTRQLSSAGAPSSFPRIISVIPSLLFFPFSIFPSLRAHPPALLPSRIQSFLAGA
jgi:putative ABC transport system permease protein